jgi:putative cell wall-binding protein
MATLAMAEETVDAVFLTTTVNYPDSVVAAAAANHIGAPVIVTDENELSEAVEATLRDLNPKTVYIIGGPAVISEDVEKKINEIGFTTERIWDMTRYGTAASIGMYFWFSTGTDNAVLVCDNIYSVGEEYKQLAASLSLARMYESPILLTPCDALSVDAASLLTGLNVSNVVLVGTNPSENLTSAIESIGPTLTKVAGSSIDKTLDRILGHIKSKLTEIEGITTARIIVTEDNYEDILKMPADAEDTVVFVISDTSKTKELADFVRNYNITNIIVVGDSGLSEELVERFKEQNVTEDAIQKVEGEDPVAAVAKQVRDAKEKYAKKAKDLASKISALEKELARLQLAKKAVDEAGRAEVVIGEMRVLVANFKDDITIEEGVLKKALEFIDKAEAALARAQESLAGEKYVEGFRQARLAQDLASQSEWAIVSSLDKDRRAERIEEMVDSEKNDVRKELKDIKDIILALEEKVESFEKEFGEDKKMRYLLKAVQRLGRDAEFYALDAKDIDAFKHAGKEIKHKVGEIGKLIGRAQLGSDEEDVSSEVESRQFDSALKSLQYEFEEAEDENVDLGDLQDLLGALKDAGSSSDNWDQVLDIREQLDRKKDHRRYQHDLDDGKQYIEGLAEKVEELKGAGYDLSVEEEIIEELRLLIDEAQQLILEGKLEEVDFLAENANMLVARLETSIGIMDLDLEITAFDESLNELEEQGTDVGRFRIELSRLLEELQNIQNELTEAEGSGDIGYIIDVQHRFEGFARRVHKFINRAFQRAREPEGFAFEDELENAYNQLEEAQERLSEMEMMGADIEEMLYLISVAEDYLYQSYSAAASGDMDNAWKEIGNAWTVIEEIHIRGHLEGILRHYQDVSWEVEEMVANGVDIGPALSIFNEIEDLIVEVQDDIEAGKFKSAGKLLGKIEKRFGGLHRALDETRMYFDFLREQEHILYEIEEMRFRAEELPGDVGARLNALLDEIEEGIDKAIKLAMNGQTRAAEKIFRNAMEKMPLVHFFYERTMIDENLYRMFEELDKMAYEGFDVSEMETKLKDVALCFDNAMDEMRNVRNPHEFQRIMGKCHHRMERLHREFESFMQWRHFNDQIEDAYRFLEDIDRRIEDASYSGFKVPDFVEDLRREYEEVLRTIEGLAKQGDFRRAERMFEKLWHLREQIEMSGAFIDIENRLSNIEQRLDEAEYDGVDTKPYRSAINDIREGIEEMRSSGIQSHRLGRALERFHRDIERIEREFESRRWLGGLEDRLRQMEDQLRDDEYNGIRVDDLYEELADLRAELRRVVREIQEMEGGRWDRIIHEFERKINALEQRRAIATIPREFERRFREMEQRLEDMEYDGIDTADARRGLKSLWYELDEFKEKLRTTEQMDRIWREQETFNRRVDEFQNSVFQQLEGQRITQEFQRRFEEIEDQIERMEYDGVDVSRAKSQFRELQNKLASMGSDLAGVRDIWRHFEPFQRELEQFQQSLWMLERLSGLTNELQGFEDEVDRMEYENVPGTEELNRILLDMKARAEEFRGELDGTYDAGRVMERFERDWEGYRFQFWRMQWLLWKSRDLRQMREDVQYHDQAQLKQLELYYEEMRVKALESDGRGWDRLQRDLEQRFNEMSENYWQSNSDGSSGGSSGGIEAYCGDGMCNGEESTGNCCKDCGCTGGEFCDTGSNICKPEDGGSQGGFCGDNECNGEENSGNCCKDCGCTGGEYCEYESNICKPEDGGSQGGFCGDNECNGEENSDNCCKDCGCTGGEYCEYDSNICKPEIQDGFCGDNECNGEENSGNCCKDCGCTGGEYCEYESNICKPEDDGTDGGSTDGGPSGYKCCQSPDDMDACRVDLDQPCPDKYQDLPDEWVDPNAPANCISPGPGMTDPPWCDMTSGGDPTGGDDHPDCYDAITDATCGELAECQWCEGDSAPHSCFPDDYTCGSGGKV